MANLANLRPVSSTSEARERGAKGGKASGEARRERKKLKEELLVLLSEGNTQERVCVALVEKAQNGDVRAFETLRDTVGENPRDNDTIEKLTEMIETMLGVFGEK